MQCKVHACVSNTMLYNHGWYSGGRKWAARLCDVKYLPVHPCVARCVFRAGSDFKSKYKASMHRGSRWVWHSRAECGSVVEPRYCGRARKQRLVSFSMRPNCLIQHCSFSFCHASRYYPSTFWKIVTTRPECLYLWWNWSWICGYVSGSVDWWNITLWSTEFETQEFQLAATLTSRLQSSTAGYPPLTMS